jgi:Tfp pilus assembly protein PilF
MLLTACSTNQVSDTNSGDSSLSFYPRLFGDRPSIVSAANLFELHESQKATFLDYFHDPSRQSTIPHERVYNYIYTTTADFDFHSDTHTATETLDNAAGNCLSLAILTTALANLANVETGYELVDSTPVFERRGNIVSKGIHVRSILYDPTWIPEKQPTTAWKRPGIRFAYFPEDTERARLLGNLSPAAYVAMYYSNIAGEAIANGDINSAFWYLLESLKQEPKNSIALNMLAVAYRRAGDEGTAEEIYQYGIASLPPNVTFLRNYRFLLNRQGRHAEVKSIARSLRKLDDVNPFNWVNAGRSALVDGEYREAIRHFKQALKIAPYLHEAHALTAVAHLRMGNKKRGERELQHALENAQRQSTRSLYQAKLTMFNQ